MKNGQNRWFSGHFSLNKYTYYIFSQKQIVEIFYFDENCHQKTCMTWNIVKLWGKIFFLNPYQNCTVQGVLGSSFGTTPLKKIFFLQRLILALGLFHQHYSF